MLKLRDHQNEFLEFFFNSIFLGALAWHGMGLGKTLSALIAARKILAEMRAKGVRNPKFMVVLPKSAIGTWIKECKKHCPDIYSDMVFLPYSQLAKAGRILHYYDVRFIVLDESHNIKTPGTDRVKNLCGMLNFLVNTSGGFAGGKVMLLSGTPMLNNAAELYTSWALCGSPDLAEASRRLQDEKRYKNWTKLFSNEKEITWTHPGSKEVLKMGTDYRGVKNEDMMNELLGKVVHFRRVQDCIDLPSKQEIPVDLGLPEDKLLKDANIEEPEAYMALLERLARAKTPHMLTWVEEFLKNNPNEQLVVFSTYKFPLLELQEKFPKDVILITGAQSNAERQANETLFQTKKKRIVAMTYKAGSEALNFQNCQYALYLGYPWTDGGLKQAIARIWRQGQEKKTFHYFLTSGHNDSHILSLVRDKEEATNTVENLLLQNMPSSPQTVIDYSQWATAADSYMPALTGFSSKYL